MLNGKEKGGADIILSKAQQQEVDKEKMQGAMKKIAQYRIDKENLMRSAGLIEVPIISGDESSFRANVSYRLHEWKEGESYITEDMKKIVAGEITIDTLMQKKKDEKPGENTGTAGDKKE